MTTNKSKCCQYLETVSDKEVNCLKGFPPDNTCESGEDCNCWYYSVEEAIQ